MAIIGFDPSQYQNIILVTPKKIDSTAINITITQQFVFLYMSTGWGPPVISWFITPSRYTDKILGVSYTMVNIVINQLS